MKNTNVLPDFTSSRPSHQDDVETLELLEERDREYLPFLENGWLVLMLGKSIVLGPFQVRHFFFPFNVDISDQMNN